MDGRAWNMPGALATAQPVDTTARSVDGKPAQICGVLSSDQALWKCRGLACLVNYAVLEVCMEKVMSLSCSITEAHFS